ncbi:legumain [Plakobranchus ocellatus]|uniref:Legumain n=1 Tax=Plakobranchus ocellatus TaxID=259542 RepID=A0AAV3YT88_9GAST|nr:legumain [Plakobranchus ocellatus]
MKRVEVPLGMATMKLSLLALLGLFASCADARKAWALLFTGAKGFQNYASHSALCNAYHTLHRSGIPKERIVVIMYDNVVDDFDNPYPGELFNNYSKVDVYRDTPLDYTGSEVSADLILATLRGDKELVRNLTGREGKVIESGPEDNIFVAAITHGLPGMLKMPYGLMRASKLIKTLQDMHDNKQYAKLVFYLDSCASGSVFKNLPEDINVFAMSASRANEPAYKNYCEHPEFIYACLGSQFTNGWVENMESVNIRSTTFLDQAKILKEVVNMSDPQVFGNISILKDSLHQFFGGNSEPMPQQLADVSSQGNSPKDVVPSHLMPMLLLQRQVRKYPSNRRLRVKLSHLENTTREVDRFFYYAAKIGDPDARSRTLSKILSAPAEDILNWHCYEAAAQMIFDTCPGFNRAEIEAYAMFKFSVLVNLCNRVTVAQVLRGVKAAFELTSVCG